jgi:PncC family amidohydrolase
MNNDSLALSVSQLLHAREEKVVFAESCTAGLAAAKLGQIPGISNHLCGSAVVYRADAKRGWLRVRKKTIKRHTTESVQVAQEMAVGVLKKTPKADWGVSVVGHLGPDSPKDKDGLLFVCVARRTKKGRIKIKDTIEYILKSPDRVKRQEEACEVVLTILARAIKKREELDSYRHEPVRTKKKVINF